MDVPASCAWLVILLGILETTQIHLAKALQRQGIETFDQIRARLTRSGAQVEGGAKKPLIYVVGLILNNTTWFYALFIAPLGGTPALYTSMFGVGLVALLVYSSQVMKETITRREIVGAASIVLGTLTVGVEGIFRPAVEMAHMNVTGTVAALWLVLGLGGACMALVSKRGTQHTIGLVFGLCAGACGGLDPFLKAVGQSHGEGGHAVPHTALGWTLFVGSFVVGFLAFLITQWGYVRRARASVLVPAYNCTYVGLPVLLQVLLLPGYGFYWTTAAGIAFIMAGIILMHQVAASPPSTSTTRNAWRSLSVRSRSGERTAPP